MSKVNLSSSPVDISQDELSQLAGSTTKVKVQQPLTNNHKL